jgi:hypothetical protein
MKISGGAYFLTNFTADNTTQTITTQTKSGVAVNTPVSFYVNVRTINGYRKSTDVIDLSVALSRSGDVFQVSGPDADSIVVIIGRRRHRQQSHPARAPSCQSPIRSATPAATSPAA